MDTLGHDDIAHAELYSREASQELLAKEAMNKVTRLVQGKKPRKVRQVGCCLSHRTGLDAEFREYLIIGAKIR